MVKVNLTKNELLRILNVSNPNLLINGDFRINQRGSTTYSDNGKYTVDRWQLLYGSLTANSDGSVTHTSTNTWQGIRQYIEFPSRLAGKTVTFSMKSTSTLPKLAQLSLFKNGSNTTTTLAKSATVQGDEKITTFTTTLPNDITDEDKLSVILYTTQANQSVTYYWAKLEVGKTPTEFIPRLYGEELSLCQRYFQNVNNLRLTGFVAGVGYAVTTIQFHAIMRIKPTINVIDKIVIRYGGINYEQTETSFNANWSTTYEIVMSLNKFNNNPISDYWNSITNRNVISLDAEIY